MGASRFAAIVLPTLLSTTGCSGVQSALDPAGENASRLSDLLWIMAIGAAAIWLAVVGLAIYAGRADPRPHDRRLGRRLIVFGGAAFPVVTLTILLAYGLWLMPDLRAAGDGLRITVTGEQFWWRVQYFPVGADRPIESANEIRLPAGERVEFVLKSRDVIHAFWIPALGGKIDMIPGRTNRLVLEAEEPGIYRGACTEFCGLSHALMAFFVVVMPPEEFSRWLGHEAADAVAADSRGREVFLANGCGACHRIRGTKADGRIGPDLTHFGSRHSLGAGILEQSPHNIARWVAETERIKPGVRMPAFDMLGESDYLALAAYLEALR